MHGAAPTLAVCALALGCNASGAAAPDLAAPDLSRARDLAVLPDLTRLADLGYPSGPYGAAVGDTLPDWIFPGYYSGTDTSALANTHPFGTTSLDQIRGSGKRYAMLMLADFW